MDDIGTAQNAVHMWSMILTRQRALADKHPHNQDIAALLEITAMSYNDAQERLTRLRETAPLAYRVIEDAAYWRGARTAAVNWNATDDTVVLAALQSQARRKANDLGETFEARSYWDGYADEIRLRLAMRGLHDGPYLERSDPDGR